MIRRSRRLIMKKNKKNKDIEEEAEEADIKTKQHKKNKANHDAEKYGEEIKATTKGKNDYHAFVLSCFVSATPVALLVRLQRHKLVGSTELSLQGPVLATQRIHNILAPCNTDPLPHPSFRHLHLLADPGHHRLLPRGPE